MHEKDFTNWSKEKELLHLKKKRTDFSPRIGEIYHSKLGINIGFESDGKKAFMRPVIILATIGSLCLIAPLTSKRKDNIFHHILTSVTFNGIKDSVIMLSHIRTVDKKRLIKFVDIEQKVSRKEMKIIQKKMKRLCFPTL